MIKCLFRRLQLSNAFLSLLNKWLFFALSFDFVFFVSFFPQFIMVIIQNATTVGSIAWCGFLFQTLDKSLYLDYFLFWLFSSRFQSYDSGGIIWHAYGLRLHLVFLVVPLDLPPYSQKCVYLKLWDGIGFMYLCWFFSEILFRNLKNFISKFEEFYVNTPDCLDQVGLFIAESKLLAVHNGI